MDSTKEMIEKQIAELNNIFTPSSPITTKDLFAGRIQQVKDVIYAVEEKGQHCIIYGERGVGKTSLTNIIEIVMINQQFITSKITCNRSDIFGTLWRKAFNGIIFRFKKSQIGFDQSLKETSLTLSQYLPDKDNDIEPTHILTVLENFCHIDSGFLFIFDEFDSVINTLTKTKFADILKSVSDKYQNITILLVGVGENVTELIGNHLSIERCLKQIKMPRMRKEELGEIVDKGIEKLNLKISDETKNTIINFSDGFPHYTHLLCKYAAQGAILSEEEIIELPHLSFAVEEAISNTQESIRDAYHRAVMNTRQGNMFQYVVMACASVEEDEYGTFKPTDLQIPLETITGRVIEPKSYRYHLGKLCQDEKGSILQKVGYAKQYRYKFKNPLVKAFIKLKLYQMENNKA